MNYSLPAPLFTVLVNIVLLVPVIGLLWSRPWRDWFSFSMIIPLIAFSVLLFWWGRRLIYLIQLQREGIEVKPSRVWSEQYEVMGDAGPMFRSRIVYRYGGEQIGRRNPFWASPARANCLFVIFQTIRVFTDSNEENKRDLDKQQIKPIVCDGLRLNEAFNEKKLS
jgi:hypothetical protein